MSSRSMVSFDGFALNYFLKKNYSTTSSENGDLSKIVTRHNKSFMPNDF